MTAVLNKNLPSFGMTSSLEKKQMKDSERTAFEFTKMFMTQFVHTALNAVETPEYYGGSGGEMFSYFMSEACASQMMNNKHIVGPIVKQIQGAIERHPLYKEGGHHAFSRLA